MDHEHEWYVFVTPHCWPTAPGGTAAYWRVCKCNKMQVRNPPMNIPEWMLAEKDGPLSYRGSAQKLMRSRYGRDRARS